MLGTNIYNNVCLRLLGNQSILFSNEIIEKIKVGTRIYIWIVGNDSFVDYFLWFGKQNSVGKYCIIWIRESYISHFQLYFAHPIYVYYAYIRIMCTSEYACARMWICMRNMYTIYIYDIFIYVYIYAFRPSVYMLKYTWSAIYIYAFCMCSYAYVTRTHVYIYIHIYIYIYKYRLE